MNNPKGKSVGQVIAELVQIIMEIEMEHDKDWIDYTPYLKKEALDRLGLKRTPLSVAVKHNKKMEEQLRKQDL